MREIPIGKYCVRPPSWEALRVSNYLIGLLRVKIVAVLLGPTGQGLLGLYTSAMGFIGTVSGLGVGGSSVREVVLAFGRDDAVEAARTIRILRARLLGDGMPWLAVVGSARAADQPSAIRLEPSTSA